MTDPAWSTEDLAALRKHVAEGLSFSTIGTILGRSRNACIGKARREGISGFKQNRASKAGFRAPGPRRPVQKQAKPSRLPAPPRPVLAPKAPINPAMPVVEALPLPKPNEALPESRLLKIEQLQSGVCKWPIGDPHDPGFRYCGADCDPARSYCQPHRRLAYTSERA